MKYVIRRLSLGVLITPLFGVLSVLMYGVGILLSTANGGFTPIGEVWMSGVWAGALFSVLFAVVPPRVYWDYFFGGVE
jgi:hypothetical protein